MPVLNVNWRYLLLPSCTWWCNLTTESQVEAELHEVAAMYDNLGGLSLGLTHGTPVLDCSCGYSTPTVETWTEAGEHYDQHLANGGVRDAT